MYNILRLHIILNSLPKQPPYEKYSGIYKYWHKFTFCTKILYYKNSHQIKKIKITKTCNFRAGKSELQAVILLRSQGSTTMWGVQVSSFPYRATLHQLYVQFPLAECFGAKDSQGQASQRTTLLYAVYVPHKMTSTQWLMVYRWWGAWEELKNLTSLAQDEKNPEI